MKSIPYGRQNITEEDIQAIIETLKSDFLTQGPKIGEFESSFAKYVGCKYAVAVSSGTAALHLSALALNVKPGDKIISTSISFSASTNCILYCGGEVVFADIDPKTYLLDINYVRNLLQSSPKGTYKGLILVDFAGYPVNLEEFHNLANEFGLWIIEDACHSPGGYFTDSKGKEQRCGNGNFANLAVFSFHPVKHITTCEGGMITTNSEELYNNLLVLRTHGITKESSKFKNSVDIAYGLSLSDNQSLTDQYPIWYYEMQELGYNYRIPDVLCALGLSQLNRSDKGIVRRMEIADIYDKAFADIKQISFGHPSNSELIKNGIGHAYHLYIIKTKHRKELYEYLRTFNIFAQVHYFPIHLMPYYTSKIVPPLCLPFAESFYSECLSIPMYPSISNDELEYVIERIRFFFNNLP